MKTPPRFTYNYQLAGYAFQIYDDKGAVDFDTFAKVFEVFPWGEQMIQREKMAGGCSATISVVDHELDTAFWVSVMGDDQRPTFLLGSVYNKRQRRPASVPEPGMIRKNDIYIAPSRRSVLGTFRMFLAGESLRLRERLRTYKRFKR